MAMVGTLAWSGVDCRCFRGSSLKQSSQLLAVCVPISTPTFSSCHTSRAAVPETSEFSWVQHCRLRAHSASSGDDYVWPEFEKETEAKSSSRMSKVLEIIVRVLGVGIIAYSVVVLRAKRPRLSWPTLKSERVITDGVSERDSSPGSFLYSKINGGRKGPLSTTVATQLSEYPIMGGSKVSDRRYTSNLCAYVRFGEDQDILEVDEQAFEKWLLEVKDTAVKRGIRESLVIEALHGIRPSKRIVELDSNQPEVKLTLEAYLKNMINAYRVNKGVSGFQENELLLAEISSNYGVPSPILVAIWGIESSYGGYSGNWDVLRALLTLAYASQEPRRAQFFKGELLQALQIIQEGHGPQSGEPLRGSWAGAMGQCQFMPSSFQAYAVDYDGDGRKDIWDSRADMFASMANYLKSHGWQQGGLVAQKVQLPSDVDENMLGLKVQKSVQEWTNKYKIQIVRGQPEIPPHEMASLIAPDGPKGSVYLVFQNFRTIMRYNTSSLYSIAVWQLAVQIIERLGSSAAQFPELVSTLKC